MAVENPFSAVGKLLYAQVLIAALVASGFLMIGGWKYAISPLIGSGVASATQPLFCLQDIPRQAQRCESHIECVLRRGNGQADFDCGVVLHGLAGSSLLIF
jgi:hypothetical protein